MCAAKLLSTRLKADPFSAGGFHGEFVRRNALVIASLLRLEDVIGHCPFQSLAGSAVDVCLDREEVCSGVDPEVGTFGRVLA